MIVEKKKWQRTTVCVRDDNMALLICLFAASIVISQRPQNIQELVNETASMVCTASAPPNVDVVYVWKFNDHILDFQRDVEYRMVCVHLHFHHTCVAPFIGHFVA